MDQEIKDLLKQILANQVVIYKRLDIIEHKVRGGGRLAGISSYINDLKRESEEVSKYISG